MEVGGASIALSVAAAGVCAGPPWLKQLPACLQPPLEKSSSSALEAKMAETEHQANLKLT